MNEILIFFSKFKVGSKYTETQTVYRKKEMKKEWSYFSSKYSVSS